ncbi:MAG: hypothetical protein WCG25_06685 [bacterium]
MIFFTSGRKLKILLGSDGVKYEIFFHCFSSNFPNPSIDQIQSQSIFSCQNMAILFADSRVFLIFNIDCKLVFK